ncbi:MAG: hypothetical protein RQ842_05010 [Vulcanisaeta sp.]|jgi:hypothetical protein|nr:hypothetical protein [Vulcanisaeta sp.]
MQGTQKPMNQDYVNQTVEKGDGPALNGPAPGDQAVRSPQDYEQDYGMELKRGDIYVWNGREDRKYKLRKESVAVVEVRSKAGVMLKYYGRYASFTIRAAKVVWIDMTRNDIDIHVNNDEQVDEDKIILHSYDKGKIDEATQGFVAAVMARSNIFIRMNLPYVEEECGGYDACVKIEEVKNARGLGIYILGKHIKTRWI